MQQLMNVISFEAVSESLVILQAFVFTIKAIKKEHVPKRDVLTYHKK